MRLERPQGHPWKRALLWLAFLAPFFFLSYGFATWATDQRVHVGSVVYDWERHIPFLPWTIVPYWSIDLLYGISLFICTTPRELDTHARRLLTAQIAAVGCFLLFPLTFTFARPAAEGYAGFLFDFLGKFDKPYNQAPSLHIALLVILWDCYLRHTPARLSLVLHAWFALIGVSVLTTYQHHVFDIPAGVLLGFLCLWLWPEKARSPLAAARLTHDLRRRRLAAYYMAGAILLAAPAIGLGGTALWLLWPAVSLSLVAGNYALFGAEGFQKAPDGRVSLAARWLFAPYAWTAWINVRLWTRHDPLTVALPGGVSLGRFPSRATARGFATVIDLCAELPAFLPHSGYRAFPLLDLIPPAPEQLRPIVAAIKRGRAEGPVLVCCALGYGRGAAAAAAWLLSGGHAGDAGEACEMIQTARPRAVFHDGARNAIQDAAA